VGEILLQKLMSCRGRIEKIRKALPVDPEEVLRDERLETFIAFNLFLLIQDSIDLAAHLVAARGLGVPGSQRESFETLARAGLIPLESASAMGGLAALRNRVAHGYGSLDPVRMVREAPRGLEIAANYLDEIAGAIRAT
jgi:uncharacterized protein YutE (UPF0331/DUF86 family)